MPNASPSVLIVGAGAVGAFFGAALARQGATVSVVCRSDYAAVKQAGYEIESGLLGAHRFVPSATFPDVAEAGRGYDYVVLATKVVDSISRTELLAPVLDDRTIIVLLQNGLDIESEIAAAFPNHELLSAIAFIAVSRTGPGKVLHQSEGSLVIGRFPSGTSTAAERLAALFEASGVPCRITTDIVKARWQKALWNATFNPISIMGGVLDTAEILRSPESVQFVRDVMTEVVNTARAAGHTLDEALIDKLIAATVAMPPYKTSMALDYEHRRPMEIEAILGNVVRTARRAGVHVPRLETIYAIAKMIEQARA
ncbi:MAG: 2-dehydropantoate 2-reductase [Gammaproteobacteria bacterium]